MATTSWPLDLLDAVAALWTTGRTAGEIMQLVPHRGLTRNSIIGKMNRLALAKSEGLHDKTKHEQVIEHARRRWTAAQIGQAVGWEPRAVTQFLTVRRRTDPTIPLLVPSGRPRRQRTVQNVARAKRKAAQGHFEMDRNPEKKMPPAPFRPAEPPKPPLMLKLMDLPASACHFPFGTPKREDFGYCGHPVMLGQPDARTARPYCEGHMRLMYAGASVRR